MGAQLYRRETCRLCGSSDLQLVVQLEPTPIADDYVPLELLHKPQDTYPLDLFLCAACGHAQLLDVVDPSELYENFIYETSISPGLEEHFRKYAGEVLAYVDPPLGSLGVDIGSNDGTLLRQFKAHGMKVLGIDPASKLAQRATAAGIETLPSFFSIGLAEELREKQGPASIITANNVIANIDDMTDLMDGIRHLLAPDGVFVFETGYLLDLIQNNVFDNIYHEHLGYHSVKPLTGFFSRHGMELVRVVRVPTKGGSIRGTVQVAGGPMSVSPSVAELMSLEDEMKLDRRDPFEAFAAAIGATRDRLQLLVRDLRSQGKTIAGYGASHSVTTLIYHFGLGSVLSFLVDDNPLKQNLDSPGRHLPVLSPDAIYKRNPDYVVVLPWRFSQPILGKHQTYLDQGGHFIIPLPELEVV